MRKYPLHRARADRFHLPQDAAMATERPTRGPTHLRPGPIALVGAGGAVGTVSRYGLEVWRPADAHALPWGTLVANLAGALVLGFLLETLARSGPDAGWRRRARLLLGTGFCGGLTTYSALAVEADLLIRSGQSANAAVYIGVSIVAGLLATTVGITAAAMADRRRRHGGSS